MNFAYLQSGRIRSYSDGCWSKHQDQEQIVIGIVEHSGIMAYTILLSAPSKMDILCFVNCIRLAGRT